MVLSHLVTTVHFPSKNKYPYCIHKVALCNLALVFLHLGELPDNIFVQCSPTYRNTPPPKVSHVLGEAAQILGLHNHDAINTG